jgi:hypothetical protein
MTFIKIQGTGQEIPDPPKFIDFCREDAEDAMSEASESHPAQFPRAINPAIRPGAVSPQPSILDSHHDPNSNLAQEMGLGTSPAQVVAEAPESYQRGHAIAAAPPPGPYGQPNYANSWANVSMRPQSELGPGPRNDFARSDPPPLNASEMTTSSVSHVSHNSSQRPSSRDSQSEYSQTSIISYEPTSGHTSPIKQATNESPKKSPWFKSPFGRNKGHGVDPKEHTPTPADRSANRNTWGPTAAHKTGADGGSTRPGLFGRGSLFKSQQPSMSPEPIEPGSKTQLNVGENVFDVSTDGHRRPTSRQSQTLLAGHDEPDLLEQALADLAQITDKGGNRDDRYGNWGTDKAARDRDTADHHAGLYTPQPNSAGRPPVGGVPTPFAQQQHRSTPPPSYNRVNIPPVGHLGAPPAAHTSKDMQATKNRYVNQRRSVYEDSARNTQVRSSSPAPVRAISPRPGSSAAQQGHGRPPSSQGYQRSASPNPYGGARPRANTSIPQNGSYRGSAHGSAHGSNNGSWQSRNGPPGNNHMMNGPNGMPRAASPQPGYHGGPQSRPVSRGPPGGMGGEMAVQLHSGTSDFGGSARGRGRPQSQYYAPNEGGMNSGQVSTRVRSKSAAAGGQYTKDGRTILHFGKFACAPFQKLFADGKTSSCNVHVSSTNP